MLRELGDLGQRRVGDRERRRPCGGARASSCARPADAARPAESPITSVSSSMRRQAAERLLRRAGDELGADVEQHQQVAQVGGEERHLVGAGDQDLAGASAIASIARVHLRARDLARRLLDVDVVGGQRGLELVLVEREERRRSVAAVAPRRGRRRYSSRAACCSSGKPSKPSACEKRTTVRGRGVRRGARAPRRSGRRPRRGGRRCTARRPSGSARTRRSGR